MIEKFEDKVLEIKKKTDPRIKILICFIIIGICILLILNFYKMFNIKKQRLEDSYNNAMYQLIDYSKQIEVLLAKARITTTERECVITYTDILRQGNLASTMLFLLPVEQNNLQNVAKYFAQVSDYSLSLSNKLLIGESLSEEDYNNLEGLEEYAINLVDILSEVYNDINKGSLKWDELEKKLTHELEKEEMTLAMQNVRKLSESFTEYEGLIYDGAYADHEEAAKPKLLKGKDMTEKEAEKKVIEIINNKSTKEEYSKKITDITYTGITKGEIELYNFEVMIKGSKEKATVQITKDTGLLYLMLYDRDVKENNITEEDAKKIGQEYLNKIGIENLESTYYVIQDNMITINYAAVQNDVIMYPDLIKIKIALDNGEVCSLEAKGYIYNHYIRENLIPKITEEKAQENINKDLEITSIRLALILTDSNNELLTYEFKGTIEEKDFLIYINADTGVEEDVLLVVDRKNGILTM